MIHNEDALICDFAETYHIYDYRGMPLKLAATLASGLRDNSRSKLLLNEEPADINTVLLANISDNLSVFIHYFKQFCGANEDFPELIVDKLYHIEKEEKKTKYGTFASVDEFETWLNSYNKE